MVANTRSSNPSNSNAKGNSEHANSLVNKSKIASNAASDNNCQNPDTLEYTNNCNGADGQGTRESINDSTMHASVGAADENADRDQNDSQTEQSDWEYFQHLMDSAYLKEQHTYQSESDDGAVAEAMEDEPADANEEESIHEDFNTPSDEVFDPLKEDMVTAMSLENQRFQMEEHDETEETNAESTTVRKVEQDSISKDSRSSGGKDSHTATDFTECRIQEAQHSKQIKPEIEQGASHMNQFQASMESDAINSLNPQIQDKSRKSHKNRSYARAMKYAIYILVISAFVFFFRQNPDFNPIALAIDSYLKYQRSGPEESIPIEKKADIAESGLQTHSGLPLSGNPSDPNVVKNTGSVSVGLNQSQLLYPLNLPSVTLPQSSVRIHGKEQSYPAMNPLNMPPFTHPVPWTAIRLNETSYPSVDPLNMAQHFEPGAASSKPGKVVSGFETESLRSRDEVPSPVKLNRIEFSKQELSKRFDLLSDEISMLSPEQYQSLPLLAKIADSLVEFISNNRNNGQVSDSSNVHVDSEDKPKNMFNGRFKRISHDARGAFFESDEVPFPSGTFGLQAGDSFEINEDGKTYHGLKGKIVGISHDARKIFIVIDEKLFSIGMYGLDPGKIFEFRKQGETWILTGRSEKESEESE